MDNTPSPAPAVPPPPAPPKPPQLLSPRNFLMLVLLGSALATAGYYAAIAISVWVNGAPYGIGLMVLVPMANGLILAALFHRRPTVGEAASLVLLTNLISMLTLFLLHSEGAVCALMSLPITLFGQIIGISVGLAIRYARPLVRSATVILALPLAVAANTINPMQEREVVTVVDVAASPEEVWRYVTGFPQIPTDAQKPITFHLRYPKPQRCDTEGTGVGSMRYCVFDQGVFAERVTVWEPGRELAFEVESQVQRIDPFMRCTRGQFLLEPLPGGGTRIIGTTWYGINIQPAPYYGLWADKMIHDIHLAVLWHIRDLAEGKRTAGTGE